ncbi:MAG: M43 family zinc metalloprotease [Ferruginibacter sp.]
MKSFFTLLYFVLGMMFTVAAQRNCGATMYQQALLKSDPSMDRILQNIEKKTQAITDANATRAMRDTTSNEIIYIPVVFHILYKKDIENVSDAQIQSQLDVLNMDYNGLNADRVNTPGAFKSLAGSAGIKFCRARVDPAGKRTSGIERKYTSQDFFTTDDAMKMVAKGGAAPWDSKHYLNIWVCRLGSSSLGYATPPGTAPDKDGVVIAYDAFGTGSNLRAKFDKGRTATHEIGHWLGLLHVWGDNDCGDDLVKDTPAQESYNLGCPTFPKLSKCSPNNNGDMFMNFMDFSDDVSMNMFSIGQVKRMRALFAKGNIRNEFLSSFACDSTLAQPDVLPILVTALVPATAVGEVRVYPSPVQLAATIQCKTATAATPKKMDMFNEVGRKVFTVTLTQEKTLLNLAGLIPGIYYIRIPGVDNNPTIRIIKL